MNLVEVTDTASRDLSRIADWLRSNRNLEAASAFLEAFDAAIVNLREFPELGHPRGKNPANRLLHVLEY